MSSHSFRVVHPPMTFVEPTSPVFTIVSRSNNLSCNRPYILEMSNKALKWKKIYEDTHELSANTRIEHP